MDPQNLQKRTRLRGRFLPPAVIALSVLILGGTILYGALQLREKTRRQIIQRDAEILHQVALMQHIAAESEGMLGGQIDNVADQFHILLQITHLKGVIAARLYDTSGEFLLAFPATVNPGNQLNSADLEALKRLEPVGRFNAETRLSTEVLNLPTQGGAPDTLVALLKVFTPLHRLDTGELAGIAELVMDGHSIDREFSALDRNLIWQALMAFVTGGLVMVTGLGWAFRRLNRSNRLLIDRTQSLQHANRELAMAAKTSALGAVTAHLVHGLTTPLTGLQDFMSSRQDNDAEDDEWKSATASTRRMQELLSDVIRVIHEEKAGDKYELSFNEMNTVLQSKLEPAADQTGVRLHCRNPENGHLSNREANLILLILENLMQNAIQATPRGRSVLLESRKTGNGWSWEVRDEGTGFPDHLRQALFQPCQTGKSGGSGIGLAICKQLANHLGASLDLTASSDQGCVFTLHLPGHTSGPIPQDAVARVVP